MEPVGKVKIVKTSRIRLPRKWRKKPLIENNLSFSVGLAAIGSLPHRPGASVSNIRLLWSRDIGAD